MRSRMEGKEPYGQTTPAEEAPQKKVGDYIDFEEVK